jgi:uncharacterized protein YkwD
MKTKLIILLFFLSFFHFSLKAQCYEDFQTRVPEWKQAKYKAADTGKNATYLNAEEKLFYYYLNLMRMNPSLFSQTFVEGCQIGSLDKKVIYKFAQLLKQAPSLPIAYPYELGYKYNNCKEKECEKYIFTKGISSSGSSNGYGSSRNKHKIILEYLLLLLIEKQEVKTILIKEKPLFTLSLEVKYNSMKSDLKRFRTELEILDIKNTHLPPLKQYINHKDKFQELVPQWKDPKYEAANTAKDATYLTENEKLVYYYLNLARMNPHLFAFTFLKKYTLWNAKTEMEHLSPLGMYANSLYREMQVMKPLPILYPNMELYEDAKCHAIYSGKVGYMGHERAKESGCNTETTFEGVKTLSPVWAECCAYGRFDALGSVMQFLIDEGIVDLGHRKNCLNRDFKYVGVSIAPHSVLEYNTVLDFK